MPTASEHALAALVIIGICGLAVYLFIQWVLEAPRTLDPWEKETEEAVNPEGVSLCLHCLSPQEHNGWFCPECGATVGPYSNYLPYVYIFSQGEVLRAGVTDRIRRSSFITIGFILISVATFSFFAPIYWFFLFKNLLRSDVPPEDPPLIS